jgi:Holliday junction resolvasome RuvABC ATP-dependent DNA helicase subunit
LLKRLAVTKGGVATVDQQIVRSFLEELGIDERGLDGLQQRYLTTLAAAAGGPCSLTVLEARLGTDPAYIRSDIEPLPHPRREIATASERFGMRHQRGTSPSELKPDP